ncbi:MAG: FAD-binding oxidoreductase [Bacteroidota bacterium]
MIEIKDHSGLSGTPLSVFSPKNAKELISFLKANAKSKFRIGAGLSGVCGAAVPKSNEIYIDFSEYKSLEWIDKRVGIFSASAGNTMEEIKDFVESEGWSFPVMPGSLKMASLGGMIAFNGGGPYSLKYGKIGSFVKELEIITTYGSKFKFGSECKKISEGPDFTKLFIGSEGTISFISKATLSCVRLPKIELIRISHPSFYELTNAISDFLIYDPIYLEMAEPDALRFSSKVQESVIWLGIEHGTNIELERHKQFKMEAKENHEISERFDIGFKLQDHKKFIDLDISFPLRNTSNLLSELKNLLIGHHFESAFFGHAGDGNWHIHVFYDDSNPIQEIVFEAFDIILRKYKGHISGEHGIGEIHKKRFIQTTDKIHQKIYKSIKSHFDPDFQLPSLF